MNIFEAFVTLRNGVTARGIVPGRTYREAREFILASLVVTPAQVESIELHKVN